MLLRKRILEEQLKVEVFTYSGKTKLKKEKVTFVMNEKTKVRFFKLRRF